VHVIAAFQECEDAITFMSAIHKNLQHGYIVDEKIVTGFGSDRGSYSIEHNSSTENVEMTHKKMNNVPND
jgi:hypothetical protein